MKINNIRIEQDGYWLELYLPTNLGIAKIALPPDGQHLYNIKTLEPITKALAMRWQVYDKGKKQDG